MQRRERTRHLIELGGLVQKAGLVELADDDRAIIYGALLELVGRTRGDDAGDTLALWKRRGKRAFEMEDDADSRANLAIEGMALETDEHLLFDMLRDEAVPPPLATQIILKLLGHPDADPALAITPLERVG